MSYTNTTSPNTDVQRLKWSLVLAMCIPATSLLFTIQAPINSELFSCSKRLLKEVIRQHAMSLACVIKMVMVAVLTTLKLYIG